MWLLTIGLLLVLVGLIYVFLTWNFDFWRKRGVNGPKPLPLMGNYPSVFTQKQNSVMDLDEIYRKYKKDEDFVGIYSSRTPQLMILSAELMRRVYVTDFKHFHDNGFSDMVDDKSDFIFANNPFTLTGEEWKERRAEVTTGLTMSKVKAVYPVTKKVCNKLIDYMKEKNRVPPKDGVDTKELCLRFTSDLVTDCVLGLDARSLSDKPTPILEMTMKLFAQSFTIIVYTLLVGFFPAIKRFYKARFVPLDVENFFVDLLKNALQSRRTQLTEKTVVNRSDFLTYLMELQDKKNLQILELTAHSMTFLLDGFETTATVLAHTLLLLARKLETQEKLRKEIEENMGPDGEIDFDVLNEMPYLDACIHEAIRIFSPGLFGTKLCTEPIELVNKNGNVLKVAKGQTIILPVYSVMKDEDFYPDPEEFIPERFLEENGGVKKYRDMGAYFGFGDGPRVCLGMRFALVNMKAGLVNVLKNFDVRVNPKSRKDNRLDPAYFMSRLDGGIWLDFHPRK